MFFFSPVIAARKQKVYIFSNDKRQNANCMGNGVHIRLYKFLFREKVVMKTILRKASQVITK